MQRVANRLFISLRTLDVMATMQKAHEAMMQSRAPAWSTPYAPVQ